MPFTTQEFLDVFAEYNRAIFPIQFMIVAVGVTAILLAAKGGKRRSSTASAIMVLLWAWMGIVYHWLFFTSINPVAVIFGGLFLLQAGLFFYTGIFHSDLAFQFREGRHGWTGFALLIYALIIYPMLSYVFGHDYPYSPTFGLPCPTVIFTFGLLLWAGKKMPLYILLIPFAWSLLGSSAVFLMGIFEDIGLLIAGLFATALIVKQRPAAAEVTA